MKKCGIRLGAISDLAVNVLQDLQNKERLYPLNDNRDYSVENLEYEIEESEKDVSAILKEIQITDLMLREIN